MVSDGIREHIMDLRAYCGRWLEWDLHFGSYFVLVRIILMMSYVLLSGYLH